jgi:hypothetical protein
VSFAAITFCVASQRVFIVVLVVYFVIETFGYTLIFIETMNLLAIVSENIPREYGVETVKIKLSLCSEHQGHEGVLGGRRYSSKHS